MRHIKLKKIVKKTKAREHANRNSIEQGNITLYFGLEEYKKIDNYLRGITKDI